MKKEKLVMSDRHKDFFYIYKYDDSVDPAVFQIHSHKYYEAIIFMKGDASLAVEGVFIPISPMDVLITRPGEMHQICHHSNEEYERIMVTFTDNFFVNNDCIKYKSIFTERDIGTENILHLDQKEFAEIMNITSRIERYLQHEDDNQVVIRSAIIEFLHEINSLTPSKKIKVRQHKMVTRATSYINENLSSDLSLDILSRKLFTSKTYLCRVFKENTGITIGNYITKKRFLKATILIKDGYSLSDAARLAGFSDYSSFYKTCIAETGASPRKIDKS